MVHRIAASEKYSSSLIEIQTLWSLVDVYSAHIVLTTIDREQQRAMNKAKKANK